MKIKKRFSREGEIIECFQSNYGGINYILFFKTKAIFSKDQATIFELSKSFCTTEKMFFLGFSRQCTILHNFTETVVGSIDSISQYRLMAYFVGYFQKLNSSPHHHQNKGKTQNYHVLKLCISCFDSKNSEQKTKFCIH